MNNEKKVNFKKNSENNVEKSDLSSLQDQIKIYQENKQYKEAIQTIDMLLKHPLTHAELKQEYLTRKYEMERFPLLIEQLQKQLNFDQYSNAIIIIESILKLAILTNDQRAFYTYEKEELLKILKKEQLLSDELESQVDIYVNSYVKKQINAKVISKKEIERKANDELELQIWDNLEKNSVNFDIIHHEITNNETIQQENVAAQLTEDLEDIKVRYEAERLLKIEERRRNLQQKADQLLK